MTRLASPPAAPIWTRVDLGLCCQLPKPSLLLQAGYSQVCEARLPGSSTALIATVTADRLRTVSLGDCGLLLIRWHDRAGLRVLHRTAVTVHTFNYPFQLGSTSRDGPDSATVRPPRTLPVAL